MAETEAMEQCRDEAAAVDPSPDAAEGCAELDEPAEALGDDAEQGQAAEPGQAAAEAEGLAQPVEPEPRAEEADAAEDARPKVSGVDINTSDSTLNLLATQSNRLLMSLTEGGCQYLLAGARANVALTSGRYMFEAKILESHYRTEPQGQGRAPAPRNVLRIGLSLGGSSLLLGDGTADSICFDSEGFFIHEKSRTKAAQKFGRDAVVALVVNLDASSPNANTVSLFRDGARAGEPQAIPEKFRGKPLYPTLSFKNVTVQVNLGARPLVDLPFKCRMLSEAAQADVEVSPQTPPEDGRFEVLFPVGLPNQGYFGWVDRFLEENPTYVELSDRKILDWAERSGVWRPRSQNGSMDKPDMKFGLPSMDDLSIKKTLLQMAPTACRNLIVPELTANLIASERRESLLRFADPSFKKTATVILGAADEADGANAEEPEKGPRHPTDVSDGALARSYAGFSLPTRAEGFDEVRFAGHEEVEAAKTMRQWILHKKRTLRVEDCTPGPSFKTAWTAWTRTLQDWRKLHLDWKDPSKKKALLEKRAEAKKKQAEEKGEEVAEDPVIDMEDLNAFDIEDILDIGNGEPLFANFAYEDWVLLSVRYELHLLLHSWRADLDDPDRPSFTEEHLAFYYQKYYRKSFALTTFATETFKDFLGLISDTVQVKASDSFLGTQLSEDTDVAHFVKLTEDSRRDRARRADAGDETAELKFPRHSPAPPPGAPPRSQGPNSPGMKPSGQRPQHQNQQHQQYWQSSSGNARSAAPPSRSSYAPAAPQSRYSGSGSDSYNNQSRANQRGSPGTYVGQKRDSADFSSGRFGGGHSSRDNGQASSRPERRDYGQGAGRDTYGKGGRQAGTRDSGPAAYGPGIGAGSRDQGPAAKYQRTSNGGDGRSGGGYSGVGQYRR